MAFSSSFSSISHLLLQLILVVSLFHISSAGRKLTELVQMQPLLVYHKGHLLSGHTSVNLIWYGKFKPSQHAIIVDFISSLSTTKTTNTQTQQPSVLSWWNTIEKYYKHSSKKSSSLSLHLGKQLVDDNYSLGKSLTNNQLVQLAARGKQRNAINIVLTASDVSVERFCVSRCGTHGWSRSQTMKNVHNKKYKFAYIWVGNSETKCPGQCAWPFHQPIYGPQDTPLVSPNNDVGLDGMVINLGSLLAGTATNPFGNGYYQGSAEAPLEAASACTGIYGKGAYPGYAGELLVDKTTGASYNANGVNERKYLLPALYDPTTSSCSTQV